ncbi:transcription-repair coupling factor [Melioribacteraceae bacterium 4301-Me]|uniref:transcription-repair coupling factor n=1 Tax=Pyranulibacter aquaticus TaxID=3163344 RepID=UPI003594EB60
MDVQDYFYKKLTKLTECAKKISSTKVYPGQLYISNLIGSSKALLLKQFIENENSNSLSVLVLCDTIQEINEVKVELSVLGLENYIVSIDDLSPEAMQEKLTQLSFQEKKLVISIYELLNVVLPSKNSLEKNITKIHLGSNLSYDELIEYLSLINYSNEKFVENPGDYAVRGSIIDFWSFSEKQPSRLEFDGDFIESIRHFDPETQRSTDKLSEVTLSPLINGTENVYGDIFEYLTETIVFASYVSLNNLFNKSTESPAEVLHENLDEDLRKELFSDINDTQKASHEQENNNKNGALTNNPLDYLFGKKAFWVLEEPIQQHLERLELNLAEIPPFSSNLEILFNFILENTKKGYEIFISVENELQHKRLYELLYDYKEELAELLDNGKLKLFVIPLKSGFISRNDNLIFLSDYQIFNKPYRTRLLPKNLRSKSKLDFASIKKGDFVVHENFGIGKYAGLETIKIGDIEQESIKILYAEGGVVYVNLNYFSLVKKFSSKENVQPKLSVLGSNEWKNTKSKVKTKIKEAARQLITLYAKRKAAKGFAFSADSIWQKELEASFFYEDTPDQVKVTEEVKADMESENPMDRLVCGDVGFGKTEIAVRASFKAINDGKQVALLVPTTILAEQHYNTFKTRLSQYPVKVEVISRFQNKTKQKEILEKLQKGEIDLIIGTHRLLSKDVVFKDLGLLIIDEEHRFGVMHKEKLRSLKANVDTLTLTATPIPRTLNLSLLGARDLSIIGTPPPNRQPIYTKVDTFDINKIRQWIMNELYRGGQVYFVHDRIQSIEKIASYLQKNMPQVSFAVAHGQMKASQLENVIYDFLNRKYDVLISTKIIESGLDIPNVNTIIINRADRFGLAELHQLRGRVGRSDKQAYAYLLVPSLNSINKKAFKRLLAIEEYTELGEGFNIAMRDLEIRGAGNLLGTEQSGFIDTVGFDMYMKLVDEAVEELKQNEFSEVFKDLPKQQERSQPTIDTYFEIGIPKQYMSDQADRLSFYTAMFSMIKIEEADEIREEMEDRFGKLPVTVERLLAAAILRYYASFALFERIVIQKNKIIIYLPKAEREDFYENKFTSFLSFLNEKYSHKIKFVQNDKNLKLEMDNDKDSPEDILSFLIEFCKNIINVFNNREM